MRIDTLEMTNFGPIEHAAIDFNQSGSKIFVFSGTNGMGKSKVIQAISLLLMDYNKGVLSDFINWNNGATGYSLKMTFSHNGDKFSISLKYDGKDTTRKLVINDGSTEAQYFQNSNATAHLKSLFDPNILRSTCFTYEGEIDLITIDASKRREHLKKIHDLEFKREIDELTGKLNQQNEESIKLTAEKGLLSAKKYDLFAMASEPFSADEYRLKTSELLLRNKDRDLLLAQESKKAFIQKSIQKANEEATENAKQLSTSNANLTQHRSNLASLSSSLANIDEEFKKEIAAEDASYAAKFQTLEQSIQTAKESISAIPVLRIEVFNYAQLTEAVSNVATLNAELKTKNDAILKKQSGVCSECGRPYEAHDLETVKLEAEELKAKLEIANKVVSDLSLKKAGIDKLKDEETRNRNELAKLEKSLDSFNKEAEALKSSKAEREASRQSILDLKKANLKISIDNTSKMISQEEARVLNLEASKTKLDGELRTLNAELSQMPDITAELRAIDQCIQLLTGEISSFDNIQRDNAQNHTKNVAILAGKTADEARLVEIGTLLGACDENMRILEASIKILKSEYPTFVISKLVANIAKRMNEFLEKTYKGRYKIEIQENRNSLEIVYGPRKARVDTTASGYERQVFSMAYKYAMERLRGIGMVILDEADSAAAEENSLTFYKILGGFPYEQIIAITHKPKVLELLEKEYRAKVFMVKDGKIA